MSKLRFNSQAVIFLVALAALSPSSWVKASAVKPNIIVILADDLGYSDIAPYGSEISTPNLDQLAQEGLRFSRYYTSASCAPTRAMLLTGVDSHRAGVANIAEALSPAQSHSPFYRGTLNHNVVTIARLLKDAGYHTNMTGKWHLGYEDPSLMPINRGFEQTVMMPFSGGDNWTQQSYLPNYQKTLWFENGQEITLPEDFYSSEFIVDKAIKQIENHRSDEQPFFSYLAFQAVHFPVQAPREYTEKYLNTYQSGWSALRAKREQAVKDLGLIRSDAPIKTMNTTLDWEGLSAEEKHFNSKRMAVYAGMVDAMDFHIGRLIEYLKAIGEYDNTVIIFTSDNGPEPNDPATISAIFPMIREHMLGYNNDIETLGERYSYNTIGASFASAAASPLGHYKFHSGEGGMRVPMIISGPILAEQLQGQISHSKAFVKDLAPTILTIAGTQHPGSKYQGKTIEPQTGKDLVPLITGHQATVYSDNDIIAYEIGGNAGLIKGDYKITFNRGGQNDNRWRLYNLQQDPGETQAIESQYPAILSDLLNDYERYTQNNGVLPVPDNYDQAKQAGRNGAIKRLQATIDNNKGMLFVLLLLLLLIITIKWKNR